MDIRLAVAVLAIVVLAAGCGRNEPPSLVLSSKRPGPTLVAVDDAAPLELAPLSPLKLPSSPGPHVIRFENAGVACAVKVHVRAGHDLALNFAEDGAVLELTGSIATRLRCTR